MNGDNARMTSRRLESIAHSPLWDQAYSSLRAAILAGHFPPGERLVLRKVADDLGISLTPVRDAVNRLIAERVLERGGLGPGGAAVVPLLTPSQFDQLMIIRSSLEPVAAAAAAVRASAAEIDAVEAFLKEMKVSVKENRIQNYLEAHYRFHFGLYELSGMPLVQELIESAWLRCAPTLTLSLPEQVPSLKRFKWHLETIAALRSHDSEKAATAVRTDIESARHDLGLLLQESQKTRPSEAAAATRVAPAARPAARKRTAA